MIYLDDKNGRVIARVDFPAIDGVTVDVTHTVVDSALRGQGVAGALMNALTDKLRLEGRSKASASCSYAVKWFGEHPEYADVYIEK